MKAHRAWYILDGQINDDDENRGGDAVRQGEMAVGF